MIRRKRRAFKRNRKSEAWRRKRDHADKEILENKVRFFNKVKEKILATKNPKDFYRAVKLLRTEESPSQWNISALFPGKTSQDIATETSVYFNRISAEFTAIDNPAGAIVETTPPSETEISQRIQRMKKPSSKVRGDVDRRLIMKYPELFAKPLRIIFKEIFSSCVWPDLWKMETVTLLPKTRSPENMGQLRNISCTPFFSKVAESFLLDELKKNVTLSKRQYGGKKKQGVDHMLIDIWDQIHDALEEKETAIQLMAIDFQKAFNRMDHSKCVDSLRRLGADQSTLSLVQAFLYGRKMSVKIDDVFSPPLPVSGGAPQGSILACFLFCASIDGLLETEPTQGNERQDNMPEPDDPLPSPGIQTGMISDEEEEEDEERISFFRWFRPRTINDTITSELAPQDEIDAELGSDEQWRGPCETIQEYIDDLNVVERIKEKNAITHITESKTTKRIHAPVSEDIFEKINCGASEIKSKVNPEKTQILCISASTTYESNSYIRHEDKRIEGGSSLKILAHLRGCLFFGFAPMRSSESLRHFFIGKESYCGGWDDSHEIRGQALVEPEKTFVPEREQEKRKGGK